MRVPCVFLLPRAAFVAVNFFLINTAQTGGRHYWMICSERTSLMVTDGSEGLARLAFEMGGLDSPCYLLFIAR